MSLTIDRPQSLLTRPGQFAFVVVFALVLLLPTFDWLSAMDPTPPPQENRHLSLPPGQPETLDALFAWPVKAESWFRDHFGFRSSLIALHSSLMLDILGVSPSKDVVIGKDGWLFLGAAKNIDAYRCFAPYTPELLAGARHDLELRHAFLKARGIAHASIWVPIKANVYPEFLPSGLTKLDQPCRLKQWMREMKAHDLPVLDLSEALLAAKKAGSPRMYFKTDTHWNPRGAWTGYQALAPWLQKIAPEMRIIANNRVDFMDHSVAGGDLARLLDMAERYRTIEPILLLKQQVAHRVTPVVTRPAGVKLEAFACPSCGPLKVVMLHDSFGNGLIPFFAESFGRFVAAEFAGFDQALIDAEKPDLVIELALERQLTPER